MKKITEAQLKSMKDMGAEEYARQECWDIQQASQALSLIAAMAMNEIEEPMDIQLLADIMQSLLEFIRGEIDEMEKSSQQYAQEEVMEMRTAPAQVKESHLDLSYAKSLKIEVPDMAVKYVALDEIRGYNFLWGGPNLTDVEMEYFTRESNFWDDRIGKSARPLTWDHAQDSDFKASPIIGSIVDFGDDEVGRWYVAKLDRSHKYRKAIDELIKAGKLGTSSDSAPQYVQRVKTGKSTWLKEWPWFASALTDTPAEPRMIDSLEFLKSLGVTFPEMQTAWEWQKLQAKKIKLLSSF